MNRDGRNQVEVHRVLRVGGHAILMGYAVGHQVRDLDSIGLADSAEITYYSCEKDMMPSPGLFGAVDAWRLDLTDPGHVVVCVRKQA